MPSAVHYVGYVEDDETPEMIMAKFIELEQIKAAAEEARQAAQLSAAEPGEPAGDGAAAAPAAPAGDGGAAAPEAAPAAPGGGAQDLSDEQLLQVFKQTSMFNVKTAMQDNAMLLGIDEVLEYTHERYGLDEELSDDDDFLRSFWSDDEDAGEGSDFEGDDEAGARRRRRARGGARRAGAGGPRAPRGAAAATTRARHSVVTAYNPHTQALVRRKVRVADPDALVHVRVPPAPLPPSWGRAVRPFVPPGARGLRGEAAPSAPVPQGDAAAAAAAAAVAETTYVEAAALGAPDLRRLLPSPTPSYQAVLINPGWDVEGEEDPVRAVAPLAALPLPALAPGGFVFVWTPKRRVQAVCRAMSRWGFVYIENLTWVWLAPDASVLRLPSRHVAASHLTLYMFRSAAEGRDVELRHQRNPDVAMDCRGAAGGGRAGAPEETFVAVETLLPTGRGRFLELWAPQGVRRPGWTHVVETGQA
jgi:N6-adenosine-specific RNA methylase IME4